MIACPSCGGNVKFDILTQQLTCEYCKGFYDPYTFDNKTSDGVEEHDFETTVFTCPQCGGEIYSTDNQSAGFCSFCGASTILFTRLNRTQKPSYIIPFKKTKEDCKDAYKRIMKRAIFAPKELKDPDYIDGFRGIYMPYWGYHYNSTGSLSVEGTKSHRQGDYIITDHYSLKGELDAYHKGIYFDASSSFADNLSESLAPFDVKGMKAFTPGYLSGFYADTSDVDAEVYKQDAIDLADEDTLTQLKKKAPFRGYTYDNANSRALHNQIQNQLEAVDNALFPVWFMSYRNRDRVAYATVNGQTGKVVVDIPIDIKKYLLGSLLVALPVFALLTLFSSLVPSKLVLLCAIIAVFSAYIYAFELNKIAQKEGIDADKGLLAKSSKDAALKKNGAEQSARNAKKIWSRIGVDLATIAVICCVFIYIFPSSISILNTIFQNSSISLSNSSVIWFILGIAMIGAFIFGARQMSKIPERVSVLGFIATTISLLVSSFVCIFDPIYDYFFYGAAILSLLAIILNIRDIIVYYNVLSTRRLPQFDKQGGDNRA